MLSVTTPPADASPLLVMHCAPCVCFRPIAWHDTLLTSQSPGTNRITLPESLPTSPVSLEMGCVFRDLLVLVQFGFVLWFCRPLFEIRCAQRHWWLHYVVKLIHFPQIFSFQATVLNPNFIPALYLLPYPVMVKISCRRAQYNTVTRV